VDGFRRKTFVKTTTYTKTAIQIKIKINYEINFGRETCSATGSGESSRSCRIPLAKRMGGT
jgi:hypothetical protein